MSSLDHFLKPIEVAENPIGNKYKAYKMDSSKSGEDMRKLVGLGTCHCCDYFLERDGSIVLLEETRLKNRIDNIREEYNYLDSADKDDIVNKQLASRMQLKLYGSLLVLCRLSAQCTTAKNLISDKKYHFWLVASAIDSDDAKMYFDSIRDDLQDVLTRVVGKGVLSDVVVLSSDTLKTRLSTTHH